jgi:erythromycin esterase-like protein
MNPDHKPHKVPPNADLPAESRQVSRLPRIPGGWTIPPQSTETGGWSGWPAPVPPSSEHMQNVDRAIDYLRRIHSGNPQSDIIIPQRDDAAIADWVYGCLDKWIPSAPGKLSVVGFGEGSHGTQEHFETQASAARFMVERRGSRIIACEAPVGNILAINAVLRPDAPDLSEDLLKIYSLTTCSNTPLAQFFMWIKAWNCEHPDDPVRVVGIDPKFSSRTSRDGRFAATLSTTDLVQILNLSNPALEGLIASVDRLEEDCISKFWAWANSSKGSGPSPLSAEQILLNWREIDALRADVTASLSDRDVGSREKELLALARDSLEFLGSMIPILQTTESDSSRFQEQQIQSRWIRDSLMARRIAHHVAEQGSTENQPRAPLVVLAHNMHVGVRDDDSSPQYMDDLGRHLKEWYGEGYRNFVSTTFSGSVTCSSYPTEVSALHGDAPQYSLENIIIQSSKETESSVGKSTFLHLPSLRDTPAVHAFNGKVPMRVKGGGPPMKNDFAPDLYPARLFDGVFVHAHSNPAAVPNPETVAASNLRYQEWLRR